MSDKWKNRIIAGITYIILFGLGEYCFFQGVPQNRTLLSIFGFILMISSIFGSFILWGILEHFSYEKEERKQVYSLVESIRKNAEQELLNINSKSDRELLISIEKRLIELNKKFDLNKAVYAVKAKYRSYLNDNE